MSSFNVLFLAKASVVHTQPLPHLAAPCVRDWNGEDIGYTTFCYSVAWKFTGSNTTRATPYVLCGSNRHISSKPLIRRTTISLCLYGLASRMPGGAHLRCQPPLSCNVSLPPTFIPFHRRFCEERIHAHGIHDWQFQIADLLHLCLGRRDAHDTCLRVFLRSSSILGNGGTVFLERWWYKEGTRHLHAERLSFSWDLPPYLWNKTMLCYHYFRAPRKGSWERGGIQGHFL